MAQNSNIQFKRLLVLTLVIFLVVLFFGLQGKDYTFSNDVTWLKDSPGLRFGDFGIAYMVVDHDRIKSIPSKTEQFSIEIAVRPEDSKIKGFNIILSFHDGRDSDQLVLGQYQSYLVVMNGDDYPHIRKVKRIAADIFSQPPQKRLISVTTGLDGTKLYVDGRLIQRRSDLILKIPAEKSPTMTLGCAVHGNAPWRGDLYGLAFYPYELDAKAIENRFRVWSQDRAYPSARSEKPSFFYPFTERHGLQVLDRATGNQVLHIPESFYIPDKRFLLPPWRNFNLSKNFLMDVIVNLLGFIPLGFALCALFMAAGGIPRNKAMLFSVALCFLTSLSIEVAQAWIPSRSSQSLDLMLNTTGAFLAAAVCRRFFNKKNK